MQEVRALSPESLWNHFADLNAVPRPSKREERVIQFMMDFGKRLGLETTKDQAGNVFIKKPGTKGKEEEPAVVLQSHLDMVHQKNASTEFDFETEGIQMYVDGDWVKARGTTLGADNGIGVAAIMAVLAADDLAHPPLEALFTIDEETGMTGAKALKAGILSGTRLLNLDTEDDDELTIGCAGGIDVTAHTYPEFRELKDDYVGYEIVIKGLSGGHSGMDIHKGLGNANKLMNRLLWFSARNYEAEVAAIKGGGLRNAIPRESYAVVAIPLANSIKWEEDVRIRKAMICSEYSKTDPEIAVSFTKLDKTPDKVLTATFRDNLLNAVYSAHNGIYRMSPDISGLVQSSNNVAKVELTEEKCEILCLTRSSLESEKYDLVNCLKSSFEPSEFLVALSGDYPGWTPAPDSGLVAKMNTLYTELFQESPHVTAGHGGLECGLLGRNYPDMEMISFGPNIRGAHSPDEKCQISSVQKFWKLFVKALAEI